MPEPSDDLPERTWLLVRVLPGHTPRAIRLRAALKALLRGYGVRVEKVTNIGPNGEPAAEPEGTAGGQG